MVYTRRFLYLSVSAQKLDENEKIVNACALRTEASLVLVIVFVFVIVQLSIFQLFNSTKYRRSFNNHRRSFINHRRSFNNHRRSFNFIRRFSTLYSAPDDLLNGTLQHFSPIIFWLFDVFALAQIQVFKCGDCVQ